MSDKIWLVEIRLKDWKPDLANKARVITYEEVIAGSEYHARHQGFEQFAKKVKYEPVMRRKMEKNNLTLEDICAPDAVQLDD